MCGRRRLSHRHCVDAAYAVDLACCRCRASCAARWTATDNKRRMRESDPVASPCPSHVHFYTVAMAFVMLVSVEACGLF